MTSAIEIPKERACCFTSSYSSAGRLTYVRIMLSLSNFTITSLVILIRSDSEIVSLVRLAHMPGHLIRLGILCALAASGLLAKEPVRATHGMVVAQEPLAADVGLAVLKSGGSAVDAAVAVGFALAVTHPVAGNIGGGGFMLLRLADGTTDFLDFRECAPAKATRDMYLGPDGNPTRESIYGWKSAGVPGTVAGLELTHQKFGRVPWKSLVVPAVALAKDGFVLTEPVAASLRSESNPLRQDPESKRAFLRDGNPYKAGEVLKQPELALTLDRIAEG